jgi:hypothetical protein
VIPVIISVLRQVCRLRAADAEARGCLVCNGIAELAGTGEEPAPLLEASVTRRVRLLERLLRQAVQQGEIGRLTDIGATAGSFMAFLIGLNTLSKVVRQERRLWAACRQFLLGIGVPSVALRSP